ncbi:Calx-beta domain protein [Novipirellula aureliae]|uniref:Calx-beta domain protein n=1 Tax=Novipirellula aureliae TaxID=2527966 RepID=A0A5C6DEZ6_9BACT|nr:Calx-beta domain-containing protein [Novipirellula aureliae]TWU35268.1 Calx-beta domain protein [Novipirellula aureliae]
MPRLTKRFQRPRRSSRRRTQPQVTRPRFEQLEDRRLLAAMSLLPSTGASFQENGLNVVSVAAESTVRFVASIENAENPIRAFVLNFGNSSNDLILANYSGSEVFTDVFDGVLESTQGDYVVGGGVESVPDSESDSGVAIGSATSVGTFDVTVPAVAGDYRLTLDFNALDPRATQLVDSNGARLPITDYGTIVLRVVDPDQAIVTASPVEQSVTEADGSFIVNVSLSKSSDEAIVVPYSIGGTATLTSDFVVPASPLVIPAGETSAEIVITITNDFVVEEDETVVVALGNPANASVGAESVSTTTIVDDDSDLPLVSLSTLDESIAEDGGATTLIVSLSRVAEVDVSVPYSIAGSATGDGVDYSIDPLSLVVIPAGATTAEISLASVDDLILETNETIIVRLDAPTGAELGTAIREVVAIIDDDQTPAPEVGFTVPEWTIDESAGSLSIRVVLSSQSDKTITVPYTIGGTASSGSDYTISASPLTFEPGTTSANIVINVVDDEFVENDETVSIALGLPSGATLGAISTETITIRNNDVLPPPKMTLSTVTDRVGEDARFVVFKAELSEPRSEIITVPFSISGTMTYDLDYASLMNQVRFEYGETERYFRVYIADDREHEMDEQLTVSLGIPNGADLGDVTSQTVTIEDNDDPPPVITFHHPTDSISEEVILMPELGNQFTQRANEIVIAATLAYPRDYVVRVPYSLSIPGVNGVPESGGAINGRDYFTMPSEIVFMPGETTGQIVLLANDDSMTESSESVVISIAESIDATAGETPSTTITITDTLPIEEGVSQAQVEPDTGLRTVAFPTDVDGNGETTPLDALLIVNHLNRDRDASVADGELAADSTRAYDVNGDGSITPFDALLVINQLSEVAAASNDWGQNEAVQSDDLSTESPGLQLSSTLYDRAREGTREGTGEGENTVESNLRSQANIDEIEQASLDAIYQGQHDTNQPSEWEHVDSIMAELGEWTIQTDLVGR